MSYDLISRRIKSVASRGQMRLATADWRDMGEPDEVEYDRVELTDGTVEIRIRAR